MAQRIVTATRIVNASPEEIFNVLADPTKHPIIDGSGHVESSKSNPPRLELGSKFSMTMKMGVHYTTKNVVCEFKEDRLIAWHHFARFIWRYEIEPVDGGTKITESFDYTTPLGVLLGLFGTPEANRKGMEKTLVNLENYLKTGSVD